MPEASATGSSTPSPSALATCPECGAALPRDENLERLGIHPSFCLACVEHERTKRAEAVVTRQREQLGRLAADPSERLLAWGVPRRYTDPTWTLPVWAKAYLRQHQGLCLTGPAGTGKTATMCLLLRDQLIATAKAGQEPITSRFVSFPGLVMALQDAWRKERTEDTALDQLKALAEVPRLVIDDLGAEKLTDFVRQSIYYLLNEREQWERTTYLTTNFDLKQLDAQFDSRISSRIAGMCDVKAMTGTDRRLQRTK